MRVLLVFYINFTKNLNKLTKISAYCKNWQNIKNSAFLMLSHIKISKGYNLFYVETQKKTNSIDDYGQFLFAIIPNNMNTNEEKERKLAITFFTACIPVDMRFSAFLDHKCPLDSCKKLIIKQKGLEFLI